MTTDPLSALRGADTPTDPYPAFAADLRARLVRALTTGATMSTAAPSYPVNGAKAGDVSYVSIQVPELAAAQAFYRSVLGWSFRPDGRVVDSAPMVGLWDEEIPGQPRRTGAVLAYRVHDIRAAVSALTEHGGVAGEITEEPWALSSRCIDPGGLPFRLHQYGDDAAVPEGARLRQGDLSYVTFGVADGERDRAFYAAVLGWRYEDGNPVGLVPMTGMWSPADGKVAGREEEWTQQLGAVLCYQVDDIAAAVERLRAAGGECDEPQQRPYGLEVHGHDDQGIELYLHQLIQ